MARQAASFCWREKVNGSCVLDTDLIPVAIHVARWNNEDANRGKWCVRIGEEVAYHPADMPIEEVRRLATFRLIARMSQEIAVLATFA